MNRPICYHLSETRSPSLSALLVRYPSHPRPSANVCPKSLPLTGHHFPQRELATGIARRPPPSGTRSVASEVLERSPFQACRFRLGSKAVISLPSLVVDAEFFHLLDVAASTARCGIDTPYAAFGRDSSVPVASRRVSIAPAVRLGHHPWRPREKVDGGDGSQSAEAHCSVELVKLFADATVIDFDIF